MIVLVAGDPLLQIKSSLDKCIHPLQKATHSSNKLIDIYTGDESSEETNVNKAEIIDKVQIETFENTLPESVRNTLTKL